MSHFDSGERQKGSLPYHTILVNDGDFPTPYIRSDRNVQHTYSQRGLLHFTLKTFKMVLLIRLNSVE